MPKSKPKLYFDTSVPSNFYDTYPAEQVSMTRLFWNEILPKFKACISPITIQEIKNTANLPKRKQVLGLIRSFSVLSENSEIESIASNYIKNKVIPDKNLADAFHIAFATPEELIKQFYEQE